MPLPAGARLGPYEVLAPVGAGGMGEVYKALDTRLNRIVAVKVLPAHLRDNPELRQRFEREARAVAALEHPHICVLHDLGQQDGVDFLVMEYLEGQTLADRLKKGRLRLEQVLDYAVQIAAALSAAHRQGIVHRDLKPGNIMLTASGVKLLDFGLAKFQRPPAGDATASTDPTVSASLTGQSTLLGTVPYMAPEQVEGRDADGRTDIFAFGATVYEMATGTRAFEGQTQASLIAAILQHDPPPMAAQQPLAPPSLDHIVRRCLAKDPDERWQTAADLTRELRWVAEKRPDPAPAPHPGFLPAVARYAAVLLLGIGLGVAAWSIRGPDGRAPGPVTRVAIPLTSAEALMLERPGFDQLSLPRAPNLAIAPDGRQVVYIGYSSGQSRLYLRSLDQMQGEEMPGTEQAEGPFFSPDGGWVGFFRQGQLEKVTVSGGATVVLAQAPNNRGGTWGPDGTIVFASGNQVGLSKVSADGGAAQPLTTIDRARERTHRYPAFVPDGSAVVFTVGGSEDATFDDARIDVLSLATGERKTLVNGAGYAKVVAPDVLIYARAGALYAVRFDVSRLQLVGPPTKVLSDVTTWPASGQAEFAVSADGTLIYVPGEPQQKLASLVWVTRDGRAELVTHERRPFNVSRLSPDAQRIATVIDTGIPQIWVLELARGTLTRLTFQETTVNVPVWTPDGTHVAFDSARGMYWQMADGSAPAQQLTEQLTESAYAQLPWSWSPDGQTLAFVERGDLWTLDVRNQGAPRPFLQTSYSESHPVFSPDGRWLAYVSDESGRREVYVRSYPGSGPRYLVSTNGGDDPMWSRDRWELFYIESRHRSGTSVVSNPKWMSVEVDTEQGWRAGTPRLLFEGRYGAHYDVAPDGRFLMVQFERLPPVTELFLIQNWGEEVKEKLSGGR